MNGKRRPLSVMIVACVYIAVGTAGFVGHFPDLRRAGTFPYLGLYIELIEFVAVFCGIFMLRGENWARWVAVAWMAFHVVLSAFHALSELVIHCLFCALIAWFLFRPEAARYFRRAL